MTAVGGAGNKGAGAQAEEIVLAHQSQHALGVDDLSFAPELRGDPPVTIVTIGEAEPLDGIAQFHIGARRRVRLEMPVIAGARNAAEPA